MTASIDLTVLLPSRQEGDTLLRRATAEGLNVDLKQGSLAALRPWRVYVFGEHRDDLTVQALLDGLNYDLLSLVQDPVPSD